MEKIIGPYPITHTSIHLHHTYKMPSPSIPKKLPPLSAMVVVTSTINLKPFSSTSLLYNKHPTNFRVKSNNGVLSIKSYMEDSATLGGLARKIIGSLPVIGLIARIISDEGGVGGDIIDFAEFRRRVGNKCTVMDSRAFLDFKERRGKTGDRDTTLYVLLCCWLAAVGAGLLKSEEILEGVQRLRISDDIEFEEESFIAVMNESRERRAKLNVQTPEIPMVLRVEKALDAIYVCCFGNDLIEEEDEELLSVMLKAVFPTVPQPEINRIIREKAQSVQEGGEVDRYPEPKPLSKEAVQLQMKDLEFLQQKSET